MTLVLRDEISIQADIPDDLDTLTMREVVRLVVAIVLEILFILVRVTMIGFFILRGLIEVWPAIGFRLSMAFVNLCAWIAGGALEYGRYYQG